jgi:hypothetical protein
VLNEDVSFDDLGGAMVHLKKRELPNLFMRMKRITILD